MRAAAVADLEGLRALLQRSAPPAPSFECTRSGIEQLDELIGGGYPRAAITVLGGAEGSGRMSLATRLIARESRAQPVAWVDGNGSLYPPALAAAGVRLERLLVVRAQAERAFFALEQILQSGAFSTVVAHGLEGALSAPRLRRVQSATESGRSCALLLLEPRAAREVQGAKLKLRLQRRSTSCWVEVDKNVHGLPGRKAMLPALA